MLALIREYCARSLAPLLMKRDDGVAHALNMLVDVERALPVGLALQGPYHAHASLELEKNARWSARNASRTRKCLPIG